MLKPAVLELEDESYKHAGHAGTKGLASSETHFNVNIEAACFARLSLVQRHKMIYTLLAEVRLRLRLRLRLGVRVRFSCYNPD